MNTIEAYSLERGGVMKRLPFIVLGVMTVGGIVFAYNVLKSGIGFIAIFFLAWFGVLLLNWWKFLSYPVRIDISGDGRAGFTDALGRKREVRLADIDGIKVVSGTMTISCRGQKISGFGEFDGFHRFVLDVKAANPSVIAKGC